MGYESTWHLKAPVSHSTTRWRFLITLYQLPYYLEQDYGYNVI